MKVFMALLLTIWLAPQISHAQTGQIFGKIYDERREGADKARVDIIDNNGQPTGRFVISDLDGNYTIRPLPQGQYNLLFTYKGYERVIKRGVIVSPDKATFIDVELKPLPKEDNSNEPINSRKKSKKRN